jgi:hypothetical protein
MSPGLRPETAAGSISSGRCPGPIPAAAVALPQPQRAEAERQRKAEGGPVTDRELAGTHRLRRPMPLPGVPALALGRRDAGDPQGLDERQVLVLPLGARFRM